MHRGAAARPPGSAPRLPCAEAERRRLIVRDARHSNRIAGVAVDPDVERVFEAFMAGEIEADQIVPWLARFPAGG